MKSAGSRVYHNPRGLVSRFAVLLDTERITANIRGWNPSGFATLATRHKPFAVSVYGSHVHKVYGVRLDWRRRGELSGVLAVYDCGASSQHPEFYERMPSRTRHPEYERCPRCFTARS